MFLFILNHTDTTVYRLMYPSIRPPFEFVYSRLVAPNLPMSHQNVLPVIIKFVNRLI